MRPALTAIGTAITAIAVAFSTIALHNHEWLMAAVCLIWVAVGVFVTVTIATDRRP